MLGLFSVLFKSFSSLWIWIRIPMDRWGFGSRRPPIMRIRIRNASYLIFLSVTGQNLLLPVIGLLQTFISCKIETREKEQWRERSWIGSDPDPPSPLPTKNSSRRCLAWHLVVDLGSGYRSEFWQVGHFIPLRPVLPGVWMSWEWVRWCPQPRAPGSPTRGSPSSQIGSNSPTLNKEGYVYFYF